MSRSARSSLASALGAGISQRRWATAAAVKEVEENEEESWPERVLPTLNETDKKRLKRQRNVGM